MQGLDEAPVKLQAKAPQVVRMQAGTINCRRFPLVITEISALCVGGEMIKDKLSW